MTVARLTTLFAALALFASAQTRVFAQRDNTEAGPNDIRLRSQLRQDMMTPPSFGGSNLGGRPSTLEKDWLMIEAQFETKRPDWADDIVLKFYVLMGRRPDFKLFTGQVAHINVAKGSQHYSAMFIPPNAVKRYGNGRVEGVAVQLFYKGRLMDQTSNPPSTERWWERFTPVEGVLLNPMDTPWSVLADQRFAPIKVEK